MNHIRRCWRSGVFACHQIDAAGCGAIEFDEGGPLVRGEDRGSVDFFGRSTDRHLAASRHERDRVTGGQCKAEVELLYQTVPPESVARLLTSKLPEAKRFTALYRQAAKAPELVSRWDGIL